MHSRGWVWSNSTNKCLAIPRPNSSLIRPGTVCSRNEDSLSSAWHWHGFQGTPFPKWAPWILKSSSMDLLWLAGGVCAHACTYRHAHTGVFALRPEEPALQVVYSTISLWLWVRISHSIWTKLQGYPEAHGVEVTGTPAITSGCLVGHCEFEPRPSRLQSKCSYSLSHHHVPVLQYEVVVFAFPLTLGCFQHHFQTVFVILLSYF